MLQTTEISTDHIIRALRIYVDDLTIQFSPFAKDEKYLRELAGWIACAASRMDKMVGIIEQQNQSKGSGGSDERA